MDTHAKRKKNGKRDFTQDITLITNTLWGGKMYRNGTKSIIFLLSKSQNHYVINSEHRFKDILTVTLLENNSIAYLERAL